MQARKDIFRIPRHLALLFFNEVIRGDALQRQRFLDRIVRRVPLASSLYALKFYFFKIFRSKPYSRWRWTIRNLENADYLESWITDANSTPRVLVTGSGSLGDILQMTPLLRALKQHIPDARICVLHLFPGVKMMLKGNPYIESAAQATFQQMAELTRAVKEEGAADLAVDIGSVVYIIQYARAPQHLRHAEIDAVMSDDFFARAANALGPRQAQIEIFPRKEAALVWPQELKDIHILDVMGKTANLPISSTSDLDFFVDKKDEAILKLIPENARIVTIHTGADANVMHWMKTTGRRPTKLLPLKTWKETVQLLNKKQYTVVQVGTLSDELVEGVTLDLRGKTSLREAAVIIRSAICHLGPEGGMIHLARAMKTKAVVLFGPTPVKLLGYPQNINLTAGNCLPCFWTTKDWFIYCPRGLMEPECMHSHEAQTIADAVIII